MPCCGSRRAGKAGKEDTGKESAGIGEVGKGVIRDAFRGLRQSPDKARTSRTTTGTHRRRVSAKCRVRPTAAPKENPLLAGTWSGAGRKVCCVERDWLEDCGGNNGGPTDSGEPTWDGFLSKGTLGLNVGCGA